jgi:hypothetical protein
VEGESDARSHYGRFARMSSPKAPHRFPTARRERRCGGRILRCYSWRGAEDACLLGMADLTSGL